MKKVITYGTFDLFHIGHLRLLEKCKQLGDELIVAVCTDEHNKANGKINVIPFKERAEIISNIKFVDKVIPEKYIGQKIKDIKEHKIDIFVMGSDWEGKFDHLKKHCEVIYFPRIENISSSKIKKIVYRHESTNKFI